MTTTMIWIQNIKDQMYYDLSLLPTSTIQLSHLIRSLRESAYCGVAVDYLFQDTPMTPPGQNFTKIKQIVEKEKGGVKVYSRSTLVIEQTSSLHQINQVQNNGYDIVALRPKSQKIFHTVCVDYDNYDIISLDIGVKLPFMLKRNPVYEALRKGKYFQISYNNMFDQGTRVVAMTNIINIIKATQGKNIIVSSHADKISKHRTPYDAAALLASLGLPKNQALATMKQTVQSLLKSSIHRKFFKSTISEMPKVLVQKMGKRIKKHRQSLLKLNKKEKQQ